MRANSNRQQIQKMIKNTGFLQRLREQIIVRKAIDLLIDNAIIEEVEAQAPESEFEQPA